MNKITLVEIRLLYRNSASHHWRRIGSLVERARLEPRCFRRYVNLQFSFGHYRCASYQLEVHVLVLGGVVNRLVINFILILDLSLCLCKVEYFIADFTLVLVEPRMLQRLFRGQPV